MRTGLIFLLLSFFLARGVDSRVFECNEDGKCEVGTCEKGVCKCPPGQDFSKDSLSCLPLARGYGDLCEEDSVCSTLKGMSVCYEGTCSCAEGWVYFRSECVKKKDLGETCSNNGDCFDGSYYNARICKDGKCDCNKGFYKRGNDDCRHISSEFDNLCVLDSDCKDKSRCIIGICSKPDEQNHSKNNYVIDDQESSTVETRNTGTKCKLDADCKEPNTHCSPIFEECICDKAYFYKRDKNPDKNKCVKELGSTCKKDSDCEIISSLCSGDVCVCKSENFLYLQTHGNQKCSKPATASKFACSNHESCKVFLKDYECSGDIEKVCHCKGLGKLNDDMICESKSTCTDDESCQLYMQNSICSPNKICVCPNNFVFDNDMCIGGIGSTCKKNDDCRLTEEAICDKKVCVCEEGYIDHENKCYMLSNILGEECEIDAQCSNIYQAKCKNQQCSCAPGHIPVNGFCYEIAKNFGDRCAYPEVCSVLQGSVCWNGMCQCPLGMLATDKKSCINGAAGLYLAPLALLIVALSILT